MAQAPHRHCQKFHCAKAEALPPASLAKCNARATGVSAPYLIRPDTSKVCTLDGIIAWRRASFLRSWACDLDESDSPRRASHDSLPIRTHLSPFTKDDRGCVSQSESLVFERAFVLSFFSFNAPSGVLLWKRFPTRGRTLAFV